MQLGFALTQHCNLRCPHCIRDDVQTVRALSVSFMRSVVDQAQVLFGRVGVSLTGGEPLLHPQFAEVIELLRERGVPYRFVSNGWHVGRALPVLERYPPEFVRLSLSGGSEAVHDAERGRGSFRRVLLGIGLLRSRRIPASLSLVIDRRNHHEIGMAADLGETLGCMDFHAILPQPTPGSAARDSDLPLEEWLPVRREVEALARQPERRAPVVLDYGAPFEGAEISCDTKQLARLYVDAHGRLATCCQLSDYGNNEREVVADLHVMPLATAFARYGERMHRLAAETLPPPNCGGGSGEESASPPLERFPCMRCARASGKLDWLTAYPRSGWAVAAHGAAPAFVALARAARPTRKITGSSREDALAALSSNTPEEYVSLRVQQR